MIGNASVPPVVTGNTVVGAKAMNNTALGAAINNVVIGWNAGSGITSAFNNILIGYGVGGTLATGSREILIGTGTNCDVGGAAETDTFKICLSTTGGSLLKGVLAAATPWLNEFGTLSFAETTGTDTTATSNAVAATCSIANTCHNNAGRFTIGATPNTNFTVTFAAGNGFTNTSGNAVCFAQDETSAVTMRATTPGTASVVFTASGSLTAGDKISYICMGI
jgi:hypothetical protein